MPRLFSVPLVPRLHQQTVERLCPGKSDSSGKQSDLGSPGWDNNRRIIVGSVDIRMRDSWMYKRLSLKVIITEGNPDSGSGW